VKSKTILCLTKKPLNHRNNRYNDDSGFMHAPTDVTLRCFLCIIETTSLTNLSSDLKFVCSPLIVLFLTVNMMYIVDIK